MATRLYVDSRDVAHAMRWVIELRGVLDELREAVSMADHMEIEADYYGCLVKRRGELVEVLEEVSVIGRDGFTRPVTEEGPQAPSLREDYRFLDAVRHEIALREIADFLEGVAPTRDTAYAKTSALMARLLADTPLLEANKPLFEALMDFHAVTSGDPRLTFEDALNAARDELLQAKHVRS